MTNSEKEDLDSFSKRLKFLVDQSGVKQSHMAQKLGLSPSGLHYILNNDVKFSKNAKKIAEYLNVNPDWLAEGAGGVYKEEPNRGIGVPVYYPDQLKLFLQQQDATVLNTQDYCPCLKAYPQKAFGLYVTDLSFSPKFELGDRLIIEYTQAFKNGEIVVVYFGQSRSLAIRYAFYEGEEVFLLDLTHQPSKLNANEGDVIVGCYRECHKVANFKGE